MENQNDHVDQNNEYSTTTANLLERSAELKRKNVEVVKKLEDLRKQTQEVLQNQNGTDN